ncbi:transporter substrate-binding domain-containing protein [Roseateles saccharophilus]|uniref:ABC-type amino acid transport substrate-binding protein n=1 Tax=Roseateles saccharophilus TaxID=304 RepID=A0A4R3UIQ0_ROSSA|nr:transporter substrate-binding domain-containing protein [Roseateles saccharophilus]MDG0834197.1 transporter substrate-binding domain-containing protein [Roseateles saccharophilus]TCU89941.1 ABC-type amino acid transport substrate-binding protein [Roseateles saccharophilus]
MLVDSAVQMPQALIRDEQVVDGLQHDIALEIGRRVGRAVRFRVVPRRRVDALLLAGDEADLICTYLPAWLPGPLQWSRPFLDDGELLVTARRRAPPQHLRDAAGQPIGTIAGFEYTQVAAELGAGFVRDDGPNLEGLLRKLARGRVDHALVGRSSFEYLLRRGEVPLPLHPPLLVTHWRASCALSPHASLTLAELDAALAAMQADASLARIVDRYR